MARPAREDVAAHAAWMDTVSTLLLSAYWRHPFLVMRAVRRLMRQLPAVNTGRGWYAPRNALKPVLLALHPAIMATKDESVKGDEVLWRAARWLREHPEVDAANRLDSEATRNELRRSTP